MSDAPVNESAEMHTALKTALAELLPDMLREHQAAPVAQVPAPPLPQTLRPSARHPAATRRAHSKPYWNLPPGRKSSTK